MGAGPCQLVFQSIVNDLVLDVPVFARKHFCSIGAQFSEVMFGFSKERALQYNSYSQAVVGGASIAVFFLYLLTNYTKWYVFSAEPPSGCRSA